MACDLCRIDLLFYGSPSRIFEGLRICLGCYLQLHNLDWGDPGRRDAEMTFIRELPRAG